jgi:hypothetical protein
MVNMNRFFILTATILLADSIKSNGNLWKSKENHNRKMNLVEFSLNFMVQYE